MAGIAITGIAITKKAKARKAEWERVCNLSREELHLEFVTKAEQAWQYTWDLVHQEDGWKRETKDKSKGKGEAPNGHAVVYSKQVQDLGRIFRVEAEVDMDPESLFNVMIKESQESSSWNPTILESKVVYELNANTDLAYYVTAEAAQGAVDSRDFINIRHWQTKDNMILSTGISVIHPDFPPVKKYVRGENRIGGGMAFSPVEGNPSKCKLIWIVNSDLKGLLPNRIVEEAIPDVCVQTVSNAKKRIARPAENGAKE